MLRMACILESSNYYQGRFNPDLF